MTFILPWNTLSIHLLSSYLSFMIAKPLKWSHNNPHPALLFVRSEARRTKDVQNSRLVLINVRNTERLTIHTLILPDWPYDSLGKHNHKHYVQIACFIALACMKVTKKWFSILAQSCYMTQYRGERLRVNDKHLFRRTELKNTFLSTLSNSSTMVSHFCRAQYGDAMMFWLFVMVLL